MVETRFIVAGRFIDGSGGTVRRNVYLAVKGGVITAIGSAADLPRDDGVAIDDLTHCSILPALVDCSVCLSRSPSVNGRDRLTTEETGTVEKNVILERHIHYCYAHGVLGVADSGERSSLMEHSPGAGEREDIIAIRTSGPLCRNGRDLTSGTLVNGDFLKIGYSGNIEDEAAPTPLLDHGELCRILQCRGEKKAVVVANGRQQVREALEAGCDAIEQGYLMGEDNLKKMADQDVLWIPGMLRAKNALDGSGDGGDVCCRFSLRYVAPGKSVPGDEAFWKKMLADQLTQLRLARRMGVRTAVGTGAGSVGILHGESMAEEIKLFIRAGYSPEEAVRCASENGARFFDIENLGALRVGRKATFLLVRGTVKQLPRKLSYLEGIYVDGVPSTRYRKM